MLSKDQIVILDELAAKATPGPWGVEPGNAIAGDYEDVAYTSVASCLSLAWPFGRRADATANSEYIAAANPQAVRELIAMLRESQKDAARYQWLIKNSALGIGQWGKDWELQVFDQPLSAPNFKGQVSEWIDEVMQRDCDGAQHAKDGQ